MKKNKILVLLYFFCSTQQMFTNVSGQSFFLANNGMSPSNGLLEEVRRTHKKERDKTYGVFSLSQFYRQSVDKGDLGTYFFFNGSNTMKFGPAKTTSNDTDVFALNFLLNETFEGTATLRPQVKTYGVDIRFFVGLDSLIAGWWLAADVPLIHTSWDPGLITTIGAEGGTTFADDAFINGTNVGSPYSNIEEAWQGNKVPSDGRYTKKWNYGKITTSHGQTGVGDAKIVMGYDVTNQEKGYLGFGILGILNGSSKSTAEFMVEPTIGTAGRFGVGGRIDAHLSLHQKDDIEFKFYMRADIAHIFGAIMRRSYDYTTNGRGSRYLLVRRHTAYNSLADTDGILNSINITSLRAKIDIDAWYKIDALFRWSRGNLAIDGGYGLFGHTKEKHKGWIDTIPEATFTFYAAGNADAAGVGGSTGAVQLYPRVTIDGTQGTANTEMDEASDLAINGITVHNLNTASGLHPDMIAHHFSGAVSYCWQHVAKQPFVMFGGGFEFGQENKALSQWGVYLSGGASF